VNLEQAPSKNLKEGSAAQRGRRFRKFEASQRGFQKIWHPQWRGCAGVKRITIRKTELRTLLTVTEVAEILRMHSVTVYRFVNRGLIPGFKVGNTWRIGKVSLDRWLSEDRSQQKTTRPAKQQK
jgi:excisionase family DNA binding protein